MDRITNCDANQHRPHISRLRLFIGTVADDNKEWCYMRSRRTGISMDSESGRVWYFRNTRRVHKILRRIGAL